MVTRPRMRNPLRLITQPYYIMRPAQIARRVRLEFQSAESAPTSVVLPWGLEISFNPNEESGRYLVTTGIYDLLMSEMLCRLVEAGDVIADVGANIGYATSLMAIRSGPHGRVFAFEPHPKTFVALEQNVTRWRMNRATAPIEIARAALSDREGTAMLHEPAGFERNAGLASLVRAPASANESREVVLRRLDTAMAPAPESIGLMKVDVEGHELAVFEGAGAMLSGRTIRDVVFEEFAPYPASTHRMLEQFGYAIFHLEQRLSGPRIHATKSGYAPPSDRSPNYIATVAPERAIERFGVRGWWCLGSRPRGFASNSRVSGI
jgi:FkbM family methyltransferase